MKESLHSLFLAQSMGLYLLIMAVILVSRASYYQKILSQLKTENSLIILAAVFGLILGIVLVLVHNIWRWDLEVLVTIVAWIILIKSVLWLALPECMLSIAQKMYAGYWYYVAVAIMGVVGVLLLSFGGYLFRSVIPQ